MDLKEDFVAKVIQFWEFMRNEMNTSAAELTMLTGDFQLNVTWLLIVTAAVENTKKTCSVLVNTLTFPY